MVLGSALVLVGWIYLLLTYLQHAETPTLHGDQTECYILLQKWVTVHKVKYRSYYDSQLLFKIFSGMTDV